MTKANLSSDVAAFEYMDVFIDFGDCLAMKDNRPLLNGKEFSQSITPWPTERANSTTDY